MYSCGVKNAGSPYIPSYIPVVRYSYVRTLQIDRIFVCQTLLYTVRIAQMAPLVVGQQL